jgi:Zn-dependent protease with chaperone function
VPEGETVTLAYPLRLLFLCLAAFFLVHLAVGLVVLAISPAAVRRVERIAPRSAARWLLALRMAPLACALFVVAALCVPSYLWLEPEAAAEEAGVACLVSALLGLAVWCFSIVRGVRAAARSLRYIDRCQRAGFGTRLAGDRSPVWVMEGAAGYLMLAGIVRPRLFISRTVMTALSPEQLEAAVRHEGAHRVSRDNLKRLLLLLAPGILPFFRGFGSLEAHWARFTEWAADDSAVDGDSRRSLSLAAALVRVARLTPAPYPSPVITSFLGEGGDLAARVDRLLSMAPVSDKSKRGTPVVTASAALVLTGLLVAAMLQPATFYSVHRLLEELIH